MNYGWTNGVVYPDVPYIHTPRTDPFFERGPDRFISVGDPYKELRRLPGRWKGKQFQTEGW